MNTRARPAASILALVLIAGASAATLFAGPLDPPSGPIASTYKTLTEVEPRIAISATNTPGDADSVFNITQPGSYYLTGNVTGVSAKHGIKIVASNVTVDLSGFALLGVPGSLDGVRHVTANAHSVRVVNGTINGFGGSGINTFSAFVRSTLVEGVTASNNGAGGIEVYQGVVRACSAYKNTGDGIRATLASVITACAARENTGDGFKGNSSCQIIECTASANGDDGFQVTNGSTVRGCSAELHSAGAGVHAVSSDNRIEANNLLTGLRGIDADNSGNFIARNSAAGNGTNFEIAAGNVGLYVVAATSGAVSGASGGAAIGSTDPWANFSY